MRSNAGFAPLLQEEPFDPRAHLWRPKPTRGAPGPGGSGGSGKSGGSEGPGGPGDADSGAEDDRRRGRRGRVRRPPLGAVRRRRLPTDSDSDDEDAPGGLVRGLGAALLWRAPDVRRLRRRLLLRRGPGFRSKRSSIS